MKRLLTRISWIWVLIGWTTFLWLSRLRNVLNNDELSSSGRAIRVGVVVIFVALAAAAAVALRRRSPKDLVVFPEGQQVGAASQSERELSRWPGTLRVPAVRERSEQERQHWSGGFWARNAPLCLLTWTFGYWLVRGIGILIDGEYSVGFKAVHTVLMAVSLTLSVLAARQLQLRR